MTTGGEYEYNMAALTFRRIHIYLIQANESRRCEDLIAWFKNLELLKTEVMPYMKKEESDIMLKCYESCRNQYFREKSQNRPNEYNPRTLNIKLYKDLEILHDNIMQNLEKKRLLMRKGKEFQLSTW